MAQARTEINEGDASFDKLPLFFEARKESNLRTAAEIEMEDCNFSMAFICPGQCARAWSHCPKIIALDWTHGTSAFNGVMLDATALDGDSKSFQSRWFAQSQCNQSWRFFVRHLADALDINDTPLTVISDRCKGIDNGVSEFLKELPIHTARFTSGRTLCNLENGR